MLNLLDSATTGQSVNAVTYDTDRNFLYVGNGWDGILSVFSIAEDGTITLKDSIDAAMGSGISTMARIGNFVTATSEIGELFVFGVDGNGNIALTDSILDPIGPMNAVCTEQLWHGDYVYASNLMRGVFLYSIDGNGVLTEEDLGAGMAAGSISAIDGTVFATFIYPAEGWATKIVAFRNVIGTTLTEVDTYVVDTWGYVSADFGGTYVFLGDTNGKLWVFTYDGFSFTLRSSSTPDAGNPPLNLFADDKYVYSKGSDGLIILEVDVENAWNLEILATVAEITVASGLWGSGSDEFLFCGHDNEIFGVWEIAPAGASPTGVFGGSLLGPMGGCIQ